MVPGLPQTLVNQMVPGLPQTLVNQMVSGLPQTLVNKYKLSKELNNKTRSYFKTRTATNTFLCIDKKWYY